jgi:hypothetical protein
VDHACVDDGGKDDQPTLIWHACVSFQNSGCKAHCLMTCKLGAKMLVLECYFQGRYLTTQTLIRYLHSYMSCTRAIRPATIATSCVCFAINGAAKIHGFHWTGKNRGYNSAGADRLMPAYQCLFSKARRWLVQAFPPLTKLTRLLQTVPEIVKRGAWKHKLLGTFQRLAIRCISNYSLRPKKNVILGILGQIIKDVKWPRMPLFICHIRC